MGGCFSFSASKAPENAISLQYVLEHKGRKAIVDRFHYEADVKKHLRIGSRVLGRGMNGTVKFATDGQGRKLAVKSLSKNVAAHKWCFLEDEVNLHLSVEHPRLVHLAHVFEGANQVQIATECMAGGDLFKRLNVDKRWPEDRVKAAISQILDVLAYLHENGIMHRDLKLENILCEDVEATQFKLSDLGLATHWDGVKPLTNICGTLGYLSPEVFRRCYTDKVDIWAIGVMTYELLCGECPYLGKGVTHRRNVEQGRVHYGSRFYNLSCQAREFIKSLLTVDPSSRPSAKEASSHAWLRAQEHVAADTSLHRGCLTDPPILHRCHESNGSLSTTASTEEGNKPMLTREVDGNLPVLLRCHGSNALLSDSDLKAPKASTGHIQTPPAHLRWPVTNASLSTTASENHDGIADNDSFVQEDQPMLTRTQRRSRWLQRRRKAQYRRPGWSL